MANFSNKFKEQFLKDNDKFIKKIVYKHCRNKQDFEDLLQEAKLFTVKYLDRFNNNKSNKIQTYVFTCVDFEVKRSARKIEKLIAIPKYFEEVSSVLYNLKKKYNVDIDNIDEVLKYTKYNRENIISYYNLKDKALNTKILHLTSNPQSDNSEMDFIEGNNSFSYEVDYDSKSFDFNKLFKDMHIKPREKQFLIMKYIEGKTLREIGNKYNISYQMVDQIIKRSFKRVRKNEQFMKDYKESY